MCPHVVLESGCLGKGPLAHMTCKAKRSGNEHAAPMLYETEIHLRSLSCMCPHVPFETGRIGEGPSALTTCIAKRSGIEHAPPMLLYDTGLCLRSLSCMCPHVLFETICLGKGLLAYFAQIADNVEAAVINNQVKSNETNSTASTKHQGTLSCTHGCSPVCVLMWTLRLDARAKVFSHTSHG